MSSRHGTEVLADHRHVSGRAVASALASAPAPRLDAAGADEWSDYMDDAWSLEDTLLRSVADEPEFFVRREPLRQPLIFYLGHSAAFYANKLRMVGAIDEPVSRSFDELFAQGVDPEFPEDMVDRTDWPSCAAVWAYRERVREQVQTWLLGREPELPIRPASPHWAFAMAVEHQRIHFETSSVIVRQSPARCLSRPAGWDDAPASGRALRSEFVDVPPGTSELGRPPDAPLFGWDNEAGSLRVQTGPFRIARSLVSNAEYLEFVESGGYASDAAWTPEGISWKRRARSRCPRFWMNVNGRFAYRAMFDVRELPLDWPAEVNCHEAEAFARWKGPGWRLPTEAEFRRIAPISDGRVPREDCNLGLRHGSPSAVDAHPVQTAFGRIDDPAGNVWQWLDTLFHPLPGFRVDPLYEDFSTPYFGGRHKMLLGGAWATTGTGASPYYRLWFRPNFYQHAGFRLARSLA